MKRLIQAAIMISLVACGKSEDKKITSSGTSPATSTATNSALAGTFKGACLQEGGDETYSMSSAVISGNTITQTTLTSAAATCTPADFTIVATASFTTAATTIDGAASYYFDSTLVTMTAAIGTASGITDANASSLFGYTDWVINQPKSIAGKKAEASGEALPAAGAKMYDIAQIKDNALFMGDDSGEDDGSTSAKRPTTFLESDPLAKQ